MNRKVAELVKGDGEPRGFNAACNRSRAVAIDQRAAEAIDALVDNPERVATPTAEQGFRQDFITVPDDVMNKILLEFRRNRP